MESEYTVPSDTAYIPNGTVMQQRIDPQTRFKSKDILFVGSGHPPNTVAIKRIIEIAKLNPTYNFVVAGSASTWFIGQNTPENFSALGVVSDEALDKLFKESFAFINPMDSGSGTHLKMMKALSYGIPIITSVVGSRGFVANEVSSSMLIIDSNDYVKDAIAELQDLNKYSEVSSNGFNLSKNYDWEKIKGDYQDFINSILSGVAPKSKNANRPKVLVYSIVRNIEHNFNRYYNQLKDLVIKCQDYDFYLSISYS
jgi:glycosyltransferase involved in cell wall biosynthesis